MILTRVTVGCDKYLHPMHGQPSTCTAQPIEFDHSPTAEELAEALTKYGYVTDGDGRHWCPWHADRGERFVVAAEWREIAPGVMVRIPRPWGFEEIEVKRTVTDG